MPETIYSIPVNDAWSDPSSELCPLCQLSEELEKSQLDFYLSPAQMDVAIRKRCNQNGFCPVHLHALYGAENNRLTLALMLSTRLAQLRENWNGALDAAAKSESAISMFKRRESKKEALALADQLADCSGTNCLICSAMEDWMGHYLNVIIRQYESSPEFVEHFRKRSLCLPHCEKLLRYASQKFSGKVLADLNAVLAGQIKSRLGELEADLQRFTAKFDYRNEAMPWENAKDAVPRSIRYLKGED